MGQIFISIIAIKVSHIIYRLLRDVKKENKILRRINFVSLHKIHSTYFKLILNTTNLVFGKQYLYHKYVLTFINVLLIILKQVTWSHYLVCYKFYGRCTVILVIKHLYFYNLYIREKKLNQISTPWNRKSVPLYLCDLCVDIYCKLQPPDYHTQ